MAPPIAFRAIPGQDELSEIPRDLSFHPRSNASPTVLTAEQIDRFNREGYLKPLRIFSDAEIADALFISKKTASVHVANIKGKFGANSRIEIALVAQRLGLAGPPGPIHAR